MTPETPRTYWTALKALADAESRLAEAPVRLAKAFKPWIVRRPDGGCQVLLPLSELDATIDAALAPKEMP